MKSGDMTFTGASAPRVRLGMQRSAAWAMARGAFSVRACWPSAFWLVCAGLPARGAARSFGPGGRRCPESGDARRANGAGTRTTEMPAVVRSGAGLTKEQKRERESGEAVLGQKDLGVCTTKSPGTPQKSPGSPNGGWWWFFADKQVE